MHKIAVQTVEVPCEPQLNTFDNDQIHTCLKNNGYKWIITAVDYKINIQICLQTAWNFNIKIIDQNYHNYHYYDINVKMFWKMAIDQGFNDNKTLK